MIDTQTDLSDINKFHYLKAALIGDVANKVKIFAVDGTSYTKAWEVLERSYEVKRGLIIHHLSALINLSVVEREDTISLSKLADDAQQHIASLR